MGALGPISFFRAPNNSTISWKYFTTNCHAFVKVFTKAVLMNWRDEGGYEGFQRVLQAVDKVQNSGACATPPSEW